MENITLKNLFQKNTIVDLVKLLLPGIVFLLILIFLSFLTKTHFSLFSRDVNAIFDAPPYIGILSNVGIVLWSFTVAILFFSYLLSKELHLNKSGFFLFSGILSLVMLIDDLFMLHDHIFPMYINSSDYLFYFIYGGSVILIFYFYFQFIMNSDYVLLLMAFVLFAMSGIFDEGLSYFGIVFPHRHILEDGTKFLGILSWFSYFSRICYRYILFRAK